MTRRESWIPPLLTVVTCGLYYFYWQYVTTSELREATGREDLNPLMDLLLTAACCGLWAIYAQYRNAQVVHEAFTSRGGNHEDKSTMIVLLHAVSVFNGFTSLFAMMILQDELNKCGDLLASPTNAAPRAF